ncbi:MAG: hypothetical protein ABI318_00645, partial [Chthoniobacteraceae bacterium]
LDPLGDSNGNGLTNIVKWAFGMNPTSAVPGTIQVNGGVLTAPGIPVLLSVPDGSGGTNYFALFGRRKDAAASGLTYTVEFTADFSAWTASADTPTVIADDSDMEAVTVPFPPLVGGLPPQFFRIRITAQ